MTTVKFDKSVKYKGVRYNAHEVFVVDYEDLDDLKKAGATVLSVAPPAPSQEKQEKEQVQEEAKVEDVAKLKEALVGYTVPELIEFAKERDIDLQGKTKKADIFNHIVASLN